MSDAQLDLSLTEAKSCPAWVQANDQGKGYYRMAYQGDLLAKLTQGDVVKRLSGAERVDLIGNTKAMVDAGNLSGDAALSLVETFHNDPERDVIDRALTVALAPNRNMVPPSLRPNYERFLAKNFGARAKELGWVPRPGESDDVKLLRAPLVSVMSMPGGDRDLAGQATQLALKWLDDRKAVAPDVAGNVLRVAAYNGDKALYSRYLAEYKKSTDRQDQQRLLSALTGFRDPAALDLGYQAILSKSIPIEQALELLFSPSPNVSNIKLSFDFVKAHIDELLKGRPTVFGFDVGASLPFVGSGFCDAQLRSELNMYFSPLAAKYDGLAHNLAQMEESIDLCVAIKRVQSPGVAAFLSKY